jgi:hypothetical protein
MMRLFNRLDAMYPVRWKSAFPEPENMHTWEVVWAEAFIEEKVTPEMIRFALAECRKRFDWPPSLTEFLACCKRQCPDAYAAFLEAVRQMPRRARGDDKWSHPAVYWAASDFGAYELQHAAWQTARSHWTSVYERRCAQKDLPEVPEPMVALPPPSSPEVTPEQAQQARDMLAALTKKMRMGSV